MAKFYGMIENIDENIGKLRKRLDELGLADNTIFIFLTDNGTATGIYDKAKPGEWAGFNAGMRGQKGSEYDGGHRVPLFLYWPAGKLDKGRDSDTLCAHIDIHPTLADLCDLKRPDGPKMDGTSLRAVLYGDATALRDRILFVHSQRIAHPQKWRQTAVMTQQWRLVNGKELYDINADPGQKTNVAESNLDVMKQLSATYDKWWESLKPTFGEYVRIGLGSDKQNPTLLCSHDWLTEEQKDCPWSQGQIRNGLAASAPWAVQVVRDGRYRFELCRWPKHLNKPAGCTHAKLRIGSVKAEKDIKPGDAIVTFELDVKAGPAMLQSWMTREDGKVFGAYYVWVERQKD
jgi:arylsulfatase B